MSSDALSNLAEVIRRGLPEPKGGARSFLEALFGDRYQKRHLTSTVIRPASSVAREEEGDGVVYAGLVHPENPPNGPYGGTSLVWFPTAEHGSLLDLGIGTRGLS